MKTKQKKTKNTLLSKRLNICISGEQEGGVTCTASLKAKGQSWELGAYAALSGAVWGNLV